MSVNEVKEVVVSVTGTFASKDTPRISSVLADGFAYIREFSDAFLEETRSSDSAPIVLLATKLAEWAEKRLQGFAGVEKKKIVLQLVTWAIKNQDDVLSNALGPDTKELLHLAETMIPSVLDVVCAAARGKLQLNKIAKVTKTCLGSCFGK